MPLDVPELMEDLDAALSPALDLHTAFIATDGSAKQGAATLGVFVPASDSSFGMLVEGEEQTAYAAEVCALALILRRIVGLLQTGPRRIRKLVLVSDCMSAIDTVCHGRGERRLLAAECRALLDQLACVIEVDFVWVPSHGKISCRFRGHPGATEGQLRAWNAHADRAAGELWERLAAPSARAQWWRRRLAGQEWEHKALGALSAATLAYSTYARDLS